MYGPVRTAHLAQLKTQNKDKFDRKLEKFDRKLELFEMLYPKYQHAASTSARSCSAHTQFGSKKH